ncbi:hypothetical protein FHP29_10670 [Nocardioides albidus]|uniref:Uncharacterized protein n=1 Tax=Nocardioides albidus TaxID=1517589 RepID=A0A5C4VX97_9ACTN|nr:hypothetical protein [Nocardioides albidus]TNM40500.1 hypothetical protein FHP29_10670 [Nocardioides albidus]
MTLRPVALLATLVVLGACSPDRTDPGRGGGEEERIAALSGVRAAQVVEESIVDERPPVTVATVDTEPDITVEELTTLVAELDELAPARYTVFRDAGRIVEGTDTVKYDRLTNEPGPPRASAGERASTWLEAIDALPAARVSLDDRMVMLADVDGETLTPTAQAALTRAWMARVTAFWLTAHGDGTERALHVGGPLRPEHVREWTEFAATATLVPPPASVTELRLSVGIDDPTVYGDLERDTVVRIPGAHDSAALRRVCGGLFGPLLETQLAGFADEPAGAVYSLTVLHDVPAASSSPTTENVVFLELGRPLDDMTSPSPCNVEAARRLASMS